MPEIPLLNDTEAATAILREAEAADDAFRAAIVDAYDQWRQSTAEVKAALTAPPSAQGF